MTPTLRAILAALNHNHRKAAPMTDQTTGPADWTPQHYRGEGMQPFDVINAFGLDFYEGNALKYLLRWRKKNGVEDLCKARTYVQVLIDRETDPETTDAPSDASLTPAKAEEIERDRDRIAMRAERTARTLGRVRRLLDRTQSGQWIDPLALRFIFDTQEPEPGPEAVNDWCDPAAALIAGMPLPEGAADVVRAAGFPLGTRVTADVVREAMRSSREQRQTASDHDVTEPGPADA